MSSRDSAEEAPSARRSAVVDEADGPFSKPAVSFLNFANKCLEKQNETAIGGRSRRSNIKTLAEFAPELLAKRRSNAARKSTDKSKSIVGEDDEEVSPPAAQDLVKADTKSRSGTPQLTSAPTEEIVIDATVLSSPAPARTSEKRTVVSAVSSSGRARRATVKPLSEFCPDLFSSGKRKAQKRSTTPPKRRKLESAISSQPTPTVTQPLEPLIIPSPTASSGSTSAKPSPKVTPKAIAAKQPLLATTPKPKVSKLERKISQNKPAPSPSTNAPPITPHTPVVEQQQKEEVFSASGRSQRAGVRRLAEFAPDLVAPKRHQRSYAAYNQRQPPPQHVAPAISPTFTQAKLFELHQQLPPPLSTPPLPAQPQVESEPSPPILESKPARLGQRYAAYGTKPNDNGRPKLSFFERMLQRRAQNPLATGIVPDKNVERFRSDYFFREVLVRPRGGLREKMDSGNAITEDELDVGAETENSVSDGEDEVLIHIPAMDCVADIRSVLPGFSEEEAEEADSPVDQLREFARKQDKILSTHLLTFIEFITKQRLVDLNTLHIVGGCSTFYSRSMTNAGRLRENVGLYSEKRLKEAVEVHSILLRRLPDELLGSYLNLLRFLKISGSNLPIHVLDKSVEPTIRRANEFIRDFVHTKVADPGLKLHRSSTDITKIPNVSLVLVYPQIVMDNHFVVKHAHENMFRTLLPSAVSVEKVELKFDIETDQKTLTHMCLDMIRKTVRDIVNRRPHDHIFLAGWGISCLLNMQAIRRVPGVTAVLNFAFPLRSFYGNRGCVDDSICVTYCPSLYVVGEAASNVNLEAMKQMRENMITDTGLIIVGGADKNLYVNPTYLSVERVSQHCVDRIIFEHVVEFIKLVISEGGLSAAERRPHLKPVVLPNPFDVSVQTLKGRASGFTAKPKGPKPAVSRRESNITSESALSTPGPLSAQMPSPGFRPRPSPVTPSGSFGTTPARFGPTPSPGVSADVRAARSTLSSALQNRRHTVAVCMSEPKNPMAPLITTMAPSRPLGPLPPSTPFPATAAPPPTPSFGVTPSTVADAKQMSEEAAAAAAALSMDNFGDGMDDADESAEF